MILNVERISKCFPKKTHGKKHNLNFATPKYQFWKKWFLTKISKSQFWNIEISILKYRNLNFARSMLKSRKTKKIDTKISKSQFFWVRSILASKLIFLENFEERMVRATRLHCCRPTWERCRMQPGRSSGAMRFADCSVRASIRTPFLVTKLRRASQGFLTLWRNIGWANAATTQGKAHISEIRGACMDRWHRVWPHRTWCKNVGDLDS